MNKLRECFSPSSQTLQRLDNLIKKIKKESIENKHCVSCKHYNYDPCIPGFITYEGDCTLDKVPFFNGSCKLWEQNDSF